MILKAEFTYKDIRTLSIIDIENRLVMNSYFYIIDEQTLYLMGDNFNISEPIIYNIKQPGKNKLLKDVKKSDRLYLG